MTPAEIAVLVVDDVKSVRISIKELLRASGFQKVTLASNGAEAKQLIESEPVNLILADWHMEPVDGFQLLDYIRSHPEKKSTVFMMITADGTREQVIKAIQSGVDDYLVKPLTMGQIQDRVFLTLTKKKIMG
jgi:two-component system chemotaxis response regulator CheY